MAPSLAALAFSVKASEVLKVSVPPTSVPGETAVSGVIPQKGRLSLLADLVRWASARGLRRVLQLASCHAATRPDPAAPQLCHVTVGGEDVSGLTSLAPPQPEIPRPEGDARRPSPYLPGAGFAPDLYRAW